MADSAPAARHPFSTAERDRRWADVRERMAEAGVDALLLRATDRAWGMAKANLRYLTAVPGQELGLGLFPRSGEPVVWTDVPHKHEPRDPYAAAQDWVADTRLYRGLDPVVEALSERGLDGGEVGLVGYGGMLPSGGFPYDDRRQLERALPTTAFADRTDLVEGARLVKSEAELDALRRAGTIAAAMADRLREAEPGRRERSVYADMVHELIERGGEATPFVFLGSGSPTAEAEQHLLHPPSQPVSPTRRTLKRGDLLVSEYHANWAGYQAAAEQSVVLGPAPDPLRDVHEVVLACHEAAMDALVPGTRLADAWAAIRAPARAAGMDFVELGLHGHGLGSPEYPSAVYPRRPTRRYPEGLAWHPLSGAGLEDVRLEAGMVFGTNVDVHDPDWRDDVGLMYGDTLVVAEGGPERLVDAPTALSG